MRKIGKNSQRGQAFINAYNASENYSLNDCYTTFSAAKASAERDCREWMNKENGHAFKVISFNTFGFSCGWLTAEGLRVKTAKGSYIIK